MESGDLARQLVDALPDGAVIVGLDGTVRFANPAVETLLGVDRLIGRHIGEFLDSVGMIDADELLTETSEGTDPADEELDTMLVRADGAPQWVRLRRTMLKEDGRPIGVVLRLTDHSRTKQVWDSVSASRVRLARAERISRTGSWTWDLARDVVAYSQGLVDLYGARAEDLTVRDRERLLSVTHPDDHERLTTALDRLLRRKVTTLDLEVRQEGVAGWMWVRLRAVGSYGDDGAPAELSGTYQDITRARDTEDQLQDLVAQSSLMQAVASAANHAATFGEALIQARELVLAHESWERARAFVPTDDGRGLDPLLAPDDEPDRDQTPADLASVEASTALACLHRGATVWDDDRGLTIAFPILLGTRIITVVTITSRPPVRQREVFEQLVEQAALQLGRVAERERTARQLADARDRAVGASQHKTDFLATMSHEIRTPLNGIIGLNELLAATELTDQQQHLISGIAVSSRSLLELTNNILDFAKIEAGRLAVESIDFGVREVLTEVGNVLAEAARARDIDLRISCSPDVPASVSGDPMRFKQVVLNLASNAVKFTAEGSVTIRATARPDRGDVTVVRVDVHDTGIGIDPEQQEHIFTPFAQADASTTRRFGGTGLGLAISAEIVAAFGGRIGLESKPGEGSTFWFTSRFGSAASPVSTALVADRERLGTAHFLVVADDSRNRLVLQEQLGWWTARSTEVVDAHAAVLAVGDRSVRYDAVIVDLVAPHDDVALARDLRAAGLPQGRPIIVLSATTADVDDLAALGAIARNLPTRFDSLREDLLSALTERDSAVGDSGELMPVGHGSVLVVEDNPINQLVARGLLESLGYEVDTADDGTAALDRLRQRSFDAVLMDVQMPRLDGYDTTRALRLDDVRDRRGRRLPILAMTAAAITGERERCLAAGMDDFIAKPVSIGALAAALSRWIGEHAPEPEPTAAPVDHRDDVDDLEPSPAAPLDHDRLTMLRELRPGDTSYLDRAIGNFLERRSGVVSTVSRTIEERDPVALVAAAHALRGSAGNLGLPVVADIAATLEELGRGASTAGSAALLERLVLALDDACAALAEYREWYQSAETDGLVT